MDRGTASASVMEKRRLIYLTLVSFIIYPWREGVFLAAPHTSGRSDQGPFLTEKSGPFIS